MTNTATHTPAPWALYSPHPSEQYVDQINTDGQHRRSIFGIHHDDDIVVPRRKPMLTSLQPHPRCSRYLEFVRMTFADIEASNARVTTRIARQLSPLR